MRRTKIVATLGPATESPETLDALLAEGVDCVRINCSHGTQEEQRARCEAARAAAERADRPLGVLFDLQGPKLRLSAPTRTTRTVAARRARSPFRRRTARRSVVVDFPDFVELVTDRSQIVIGDGLPRFAVASIDGRPRPPPTARRRRARSARARASTSPTRGRNLPALTEKDIADLALAAELEADFVALSFVRSAADVVDLRDRLRAARLAAPARSPRSRRSRPTSTSTRSSHVADGIMVARGDYGVEAGVARVPLMQKDAIFRATQHGKTVITATQMLESMIHAPEPTRAEAADVANAVIDGTSAVMLSAETGVGEYPVEAVRAMAEIAHAAEASPVIHGRCRGRRTTTRPPRRSCTPPCMLAEDLDVAALVIPSATGGGARACSKYRPEPADRRAGARRAGRQSADARVGRGRGDDGGRRERRRPRGGRAACARARSPISTAAASVVLTAGRRTGTPGATSLIMVREVP